MRLGLKLSLLLAGASAAPLTLATGVIVPVSREQVRTQLDGLYAQNAAALADGTDRALRDKLEALSLASTALRLASLDAPSLENALRLVYRQTQGADVVGLFDEQGHAVTNEAFLSHPEKNGMRGHEGVDEPGLQAFARNVPLQAAVSAGNALSPVYVARAADGAMVPRLVMAVRLPGARDTRWVLAAELSLRSLVERFQSVRLGATGYGFLLDAEGHPIAHPDAARIASQESVGPGLPPGMLGAQSEVKLTGWRAGVVQSASEALSPFERQQRAALWWAAAGLGGAFILGFGSIRRVTSPVRALQAAAHAVADGNLDTEVAVTGKDELAELAESFNRMTRGLRERERLKKTLSRYVSGEIATRILLEDSDLDLKGERTEVTVLFLDIRDFTGLSERLTPEEVVELLNAYFEQIVTIVMRNQGVVNKFIGDAVMAVFGAPRRVDKPEERAVRAALEIQLAITALSEQRKKASLETARFGAGVNTGPVIAGNLGGRERLEYTVIGDAVNLAQRLEGQAGPGQVVVSADTLERLGGSFRVEPQGEVRVKGKQKAVQLYRILSERQEPAPAAELKG